MKKLFSIFTALTASLGSGCAESKQPVAIVEAPGTWEKDPSSTADELTFNSKPEGQQIIVTAHRMKTAPKDMNQAVELAVKIFKLRLAAFVTLSQGTAKLDNPESNATETGVICLCRGYVEKDKVRIAVRVEASPSSTIVRSTSVYDYSGKSAEEFVSWSNAMLAGVK